MSTSAPTHPTLPQSRLKALLVRHPLVSFFVLAYAGAWILEIPLALSATGTGLLPYTIPLPAMALIIAAATYVGPTGAAFVMTGLLEGRPGVKALLRRYVRWRVGVRWYLFVLLGIPAVEILGALAAPGALASMQPLSAAMVLGYPLALVMTFFLGGPLGEEPGWRGFALPRLQSLHGPLLGSVILGVLWAVWHFPLFWTGVWTPLSVPNMIMFVVMITGLTIIMSWVFNNASGSLLLTMLMHASFNTFADKIVAPMFPAPILIEYGLLPELIGFGATALVLIVLTRGRLGYQNNRLDAREPAPAPAPT